MGLFAILCLACSAVYRRGDVLTRVNGNRGAACVRDTRVGFALTANDQLNASCASRAHRDSSHHFSMKIALFIVGL
jgi:hypothetical protein